MLRKLKHGPSWWGSPRTCCIRSTCRRSSRGRCRTRRCAMTPAGDRSSSRSGSSTARSRVPPGRTRGPQRRARRGGRREPEATENENDSRPSRAGLADVGALRGACSRSRRRWTRPPRGRRGEARGRAPGGGGAARGRGRAAKGGERRGWRRRRRRGAAATTAGAVWVRASRSPGEPAAVRVQPVYGRSSRPRRRGRARGRAGGV